MSMEWIGLDKQQEAELWKRLGMKEKMIPNCIQENELIMADIIAQREDEAIKKLNSEYLGRMIAFEKAKSEAKAHKNAANEIAAFIKKYDRDESFRIDVFVESVNTIQKKPVEPAKPEEMEFQYERQPLNWVECAPCIWQASSKYHDDNVPFFWRIDENDYGKYEINNSTAELINLLECPVFETLEDAKRFCEEEEAFDDEKPWKQEHEIDNLLHKKIAEPHARTVKGVKLYPPASFDVIYKKWSQP